MDNRKQLKDGTLVKYVGHDTVAYEKGKIYKIISYDEELDMYGLMSELGYVYLVGPENLEACEENKE